MRHLVTGISVVTIIILCVVWWLNGAEMEDAWIYAFGIFIVVVPTIEAYFKQKKDQ